MSEPDGFSLDPWLETDSAFVLDLPLSTLRLSGDARYPWLLLVPRKPNLIEIIDLDAADRTQLMAEIAQVSSALKAITGCDKLNVGALGNMVAQLHVHVIARFNDDPAWPGPVWGVGEAQARSPEARGEMIGALRRALD
ncbi:HIT family protein [Breoghania sp. L-A4]|uniref:HIT domain-containing protein n=1 Tax=Breoghania sp. L-A4 TaxID=2304600 RepID=UPI000E35A2B7|nr:HIT family protein [Breoghania sp. L-A4]AXS39023.1 HIT domain-containing protein [Breoghania sp. L-A4]